MLKMAVGHSDDVEPKDAIAEAIEQCRASLGEAIPQAAILFSTFDAFDTWVPAAIREAFPGIAVMGTTSGAEMSSVGGYREDSVTLATFASDEVDITVGLGSGLTDDLDAACRAAVEQAMAGTSKEPKVCVMVTEPYIVEPQHTLQAMRRALPEGVVLVGGASGRSDFSAVTPTYQFVNETVVDNGFAIMLFSGPVVFSTSVGTGWKTIGPRGTVTRSENGSLNEVDGKPAVEFVKRYLDEIGPATYGNPLAVFEQGTDDFYLRAIPTVTEDGSLPVGTIPIGAEVQLTTADTDAILSGTRDALREARERFPAGAKPEAALLFSCAIRKFLLGTQTKVEAELAQSAFGTAVPLVGLYCFGEVGPIEGADASRFLNETFVTLLLGT